VRMVFFCAQFFPLARWLHNISQMGCLSRVEWATIRGGHPIIFSLQTCISTSHLILTITIDIFSSRTYLFTQAINLNPSIFHKQKR
jgi:hypothetical protein